MSEESTKMHKKVVVNLHSVVQKTSMQGKMCNLWHVRGASAYRPQLAGSPFQSGKTRVEGVKLAREIALQK